jgi:hypothetical protein
VSSTCFSDNRVWPEDGEDGSGFSWIMAIGAWNECIRGDSHEKFLRFYFLFWSLTLIRYICLKREGQKGIPMDVNLKARKTPNT